MTIVVTCTLPAGLQVEHDGHKVLINGAHVGIDMDSLPRNGMAPDTAQRVSGAGLTVLEGRDADAFDAWWKEMTLDSDGKPLRDAFAPIATGALARYKSEGDARKEAAKGDGSVGGLDPVKDLPKGLEPAKDK